MHMHAYVHDLCPDEERHEGGGASDGSGLDPPEREDGPGDGPADQNSAWSARLQ